ncbi:MAG: hypothetical protein N4A46_10240 [Schleiferiaceae bacterium]|jgi:hypothetical protein|nr:hypothetical protein [Schleiferiaceae bacterium]
MQQIKLALFGLITLSIISCTEENKKDNSVEEKKEIEILKAELTHYPLTDEIDVYGVDAEFLNPLEGATYDYVVTLFQGEQQWVDTTRFFAHKDEPARLQIIFSESKVDDTNPAAFSGKLYPVIENKDAR